MGEQAGGDLHHELESPYMALKVHGQVLDYYGPEEVFCPLLYSIGIRFKSIILLRGNIHGGQDSH